MYPIATEISSFKSIGLDELDKVKLMNRMDKKYMIHVSLLPEVLYTVRNDYFVLSVDDISRIPYASTYYDTPESKFYYDHHNGRLNRYKIRKRTYLNSGLTFLEVKFKNNKGRTIKKRIKSSEKPELTLEEKAFLQLVYPDGTARLKPVLSNRFDRITLVSKHFDERCTIDRDLLFITENKSIRVEDLVIVEIKSSLWGYSSALGKALRDFRIKPAGFSKYAIGRSLTDDSLKQNAFKAKIRRIEKTIGHKLILNNN